MKSDIGRSLVDLFQTRLSVRLTAMFILVAVVPMSLVGILSYQRAESGLVGLALGKMEQETALTAKDMQTFLGQFSSDLLALSDTPPIQGVIRARDNGGIDPKQNDPYEVWVKRLTTIFVANVQNKQFYHQLRYVDEKGDEMVRVDFPDGNAMVVSGTDGLQNTRHISAFIEARALQTGEFYISPVKLNRSDSGFEVPHTPVILFSTPVFDPAGDFRGVVVSTVFAESFLSRLVADEGQIYLTNDEGFYLQNPDTSRNFGFDLGTNYNLDDDFPDAHDRLVQTGADSHVILRPFQG